MGAHGERIKAEHERSGLSLDQIRAKKIARCKARGIERRAKRRAAAEARQAKSNVAKGRQPITKG